MLPDPEALADLVATAIKSATAPLHARIASLEQRLASLPTPRDGRDGIDGKDGAPGKDADLSELIDLKAELSGLRFDLNVISAKADPDLPTLVKAEVGQAVAALPLPKDGTSVGLADVEPLILSAVKSAVDALPAPQDGRSVTVDDVAPLLEALVTKAVDARPVPKDGVGVVDALVNRDGHLVQTFSDGRTKDVGQVVGRDVDMETVSRVIAEKVAEAVAEMPRPKDGRDGTLEQLKLAQLDDETIQFLRADGSPVEGGMVRLSGFFDKGVWVEGDIYRKGYAVTYGGSVFIAQRETTSRPETDDSWRLAVKRGRDGKNGRDVAPGPKPPVRLNG